MTLEENKNNEKDRILTEIIKLSNEIQALKEDLKKHTPISQTSTSNGLPFEIASVVDMIKEQIDSSTKFLLSEIKSEFYRLITLFYTSSDIDEKEKLLKELDIDRTKYKKQEETLNQEEQYSIVDEQKEYISRLVSMLEEREQLIYELSDQVVALSVKKSEIEKELNNIKEEKEQWNKVKKITQKLVSTDPRYKIISMLKQLQSISQMQLSFVLGISLSQTKQYLKELEEIKIVQLKEDDTVELDPNFDTTVI
ncbi:MAG: hypothetical protein ACTSXD_13895 [Candidatus Heimdallarchaeaceae archaeon]